MNYEAMWRKADAKGREEAALAGYGDDFAAAHALNEFLYMALPSGKWTEAAQVVRSALAAYRRGKS